MNGILNFELRWNHTKFKYVIENHTKILMFSIHYILSSVANICENYNLYPMVHIRRYDVSQWQKCQVNNLVI